MWAGVPRVPGSHWTFRPNPCMKESWRWYPMGTEQDPDDAPASQKDILLAAKAMYHRFQEVVDARVKEVEQGLSFRLGKLLEVEVERRVGAMQGGILDYLGKTLVDDTARRLKDLEG